MALSAALPSAKMQCGSAPKVVHARLASSKVTLRTRSTFGSRKNSHGVFSAFFKGSYILAAAAIETSESSTEDAEQSDMEIALPAGEAEEQVVADSQESQPGSKDGKKQRKGRRPRKTITVKMEDLVPNQMLKGKVCNVTSYGAFVDIGSQSDGLVHISELSTGFVTEVGEIVAVGQEVDVRVISVDMDKKRIALSMISKEQQEEAKARTQATDGETEGEKPAAGKVARRQKREKKQQRPKVNLKKGQKIKAPVASVTSFGCFVTVAEGVEGLVHISEMTEETDKEAKDLVEVGDELEVRVLSVQGGKISLTMKEQLDASAFTSVSPDIGSAETALELALKKAGLTRELFPEKEDSTIDEPVQESVPAVESSVETNNASEVTAAATVTAPSVSAKDVKALRDQTGAGMMDCKKALAECDGDISAAAEYLRKKGMASADKKASRVAAEGAVGSYIHAGARIGVLVEVNCETDFVARGEIFQQLVQDIAMQIAASPDVEFVSTADADPEWVAKEKEIEMGKEDILSKPENIREKMVEGRLAKTIKEKALLEQAFIKDTNKTVGEYLKETVASCGENLQIRRFQRYNLGEGIEKKTVNFAEEVAQQTGRA